MLYQKPMPGQEKLIVHFNEIGAVNAMGSSSGIVIYNFEDNNAYDQVYYYRIKLLDNDGNYTYTKQIYISNELDGNVFIYPNPTLDKFTIRIASLKNEKVSIQLTDLTGKVVEEYYDYTSNQAIVIGQDIAAGTYLLSVTHSGRITINKLVKF